jgi:hypothetical protein
MSFVLIANIKMGTKTLLCNTAVEVALASSYEDVFLQLVDKNYLSLAGTSAQNTVPSLHIDMVNKVFIFPMNCPSQTINIASIDMKILICRNEFSWCLF